MKVCFAVNFTALCMVFPEASIRIISTTLKQIGCEEKTIRQHVVNMLEAFSGLKFRTRFKAFDCQKLNSKTVKVRTDRRS